MSDSSFNQSDDGESLAQMQRLLDIMRRLRDPDTGCPWDLAQTFSTIAPYTIEEAYEVADAIERNDLVELRAELGDLLLQVVFHAQIASDSESFGFADVAGSIADKMVRRHPHVFADMQFDNEHEQHAHWENLKEQERLASADANEHPSALDGVALALPALTRAEKIQKRAARAGFDWREIEPVFDVVSEELNELREAVQAADHAAMDDELGDLLFSVCNLARHARIDPEQALKRSTTKFEARFRHVEAALHREGREMDSVSQAELDDYWKAAKNDTARE